MTNRVVMSEKDARQVGKRFRRTAAEVQGARKALVGTTSLVATGAGEFALHVEDGARGLTATVRLTLDVYASAAELIARNTQDQWNDIERIDARSGS